MSVKISGRSAATSVFGLLDRLKALIETCRIVFRNITGLISGLMMGLLLAGALSVAGCSNATELAPAQQPLSKEAMRLLGHKGMASISPVFVRIFKEESELEVWKARDDGRYYHYKTYPICNWSGQLGPKQRQGDKQAPEGFYQVAAHQMNPNSKFHVAFNLGYPNAYDKAHNRTGDFLMVHGKCESAGCYAMTDALVEEIYGLAREAFKGGQEKIHVHAFPFRMTQANMERHKKNKWIRFWNTMKQGYDHFEIHRIPPTVAICERRYVVNVHLPVNRRIHAQDRCPNFERPMIEPFVPRPSEEQIASERIVVPGRKVRVFAKNQTPRRPEGGFALGGPVPTPSTPIATPTALR
ncbi:MAG: L,D-transpeptidase family protein [Hyphomicrobiaceae bacterium]